MKKLNYLLLILVLSVFSFSCTSNTNGSNKNNKLSQQVESPSNTNSYEEVDKLPQKYSSQQAKEDGAVTNAQGRVSNIEKLDKFIEDVNNKKAKNGEKVRIVNYTVEGDAIIYDLSYDNQTIKLVVDGTRDKFTSPRDKKKITYKVEEIYKQSGNDGTVYKIKTNENREINLISIIDR